MPTIGDLLADPHLGLRLLAAQGANHREIRWAHATELADPIELIEGGELLLLTGVALPSDGAGQAAYVERVAAAGVAGLGFGVGLSHCSVPPALIEAADRHGLPLLEVPRPTPFMAITRAVADALARRELAEKEFVLAAQRRLTAAAVGRTGSVAVLDEVVGVVGGWGLLLGRSGTLLAAAPAAAGCRLDAISADLARLRSAPGTASIATYDGQTGTWVQSLNTDTELVGFLAVGRSSALSPAERQVVNAAVPLFVLALDRSCLIGRGLERLQTSVLRLLVLGQVTVVEPVAAELWNGLPDTPVALVTCRGTRFAIGAAVERLLADREVAARPVLHAQLDGGLVCVAAAADIDVVLTALHPVDGLRVGVSDPAELDELRQARGQADRAVDAAGVGSGATVVRFRDIPRSGLLDVLASPAVTELSHRLLAPLRNDPAARVDMLRSLTAWLAHHGQWEPAAAELGIHRHTLRSRIQRAESLLGRRLDSPDLRAELWVALRSAHPATRDTRLSDRMS